MKHVLLVTVSSLSRESLLHRLRFRNCFLDTAGGEEETMALVRRRRYDLIILAGSAASRQEAKLFRRLKKECPEAAFILLPAGEEDEAIMDIMELGITEKAGFPSLSD